MTTAVMLDLPQVTWGGAGLAVTAILIGAVLSWLVRLGVGRVLLWRGRGESSAAVFARLAGWAVTAASIGAALTILFPSVKPVDVLGGVSVVSIAAGIAFQTVLGNMFAGIVLLARDRFRVGDQIAVHEHRGTVTGMRLTSTSVRTFDGRLVLVPNGVLHSEIVTVQTGYQEVRTAVPIALDEETDLRQACAVALEVMAQLPEVLNDPPPEAFLIAVGTGTVQLELRFWSGARQLETKAAQHAVIREVLTAYRKAGVQTGSDVLVLDAVERLRALVAGPTLDSASPTTTRAT